MPSPVRLVPWNNPFVPALARFLAGIWDRGPENILVVFPHERPRRYLRRALAELPGLPRPTLMPVIQDVPGLFAALARDLRPAPARRAQRLDLAGLLYDIVERLRGSGQGLLAKLPLDRLEFFPWGLRLATLLEELLRQDVEPPDLDQARDAVEPFAAALLEQLGGIYSAYVAELETRGWSTPGLDCREVRRDMDQVLAGLEGTTVILAGHYALSGAEDVLFRALWERGAEVLWHADPALATGGPVHWCEEEHARGLSRWGARAELLEEPGPKAMPELRFYEGFDLHSQLAALERELPDSPENTAVVLPDAGALIPVLHHLPERDVNISMGYPLERTALFQLLETVLTLQENRTDHGYLWRDVIALIRHPYLKMLPVGEGQPLRGLFHAWEQEIRSGRRFLDPFALPRHFAPELPEEEREAAGTLLEAVLERCLRAFENPATLADLARAVDGLARLLHEHGGGLWKRHLLDAECLFRLFGSVVPQLGQSAISRDPYPRDLLFSILRRLCADERVSFEPEPLTGLQVMGMLETRLLHFRRLYLLDAVESLLPGQPAADPLLPDSLRVLLGLPDSRRRDHVAGYTLHRLLRGAEEAVLLYKNGVTPGVLDGKSVRSRFVEELLWGLEKERGTLIKAGDAPPLLAVSFRVTAIPSGAPAVPKDGAVRDQLLARLTSRGLSPSRLDDYLACPKLFFYRVLTGLRPPREVDEDGDPQVVGSLVHGVLEAFLRPHLNQTLRLADLDAEALGDAFAETLEASPELAGIPLDRRLALALAGRHRLTRYLESQDAETTILALEQPVNAIVEAAGLRVPLTGTLDRVDQREDGVVVLDYKTGANLPRPRAGVWHDDALWEALAACDPAADPRPDLLEELGDKLRGMQLPLYLQMAAQALPDSPPRDAGWIELAREGKEILLLGREGDDELRDLLVRDRLPLLTDFLVRHIVGAPEFFPRPGRLCARCDFREACGA
ncbi:PD-(D/E)XK nuclease family protein [Desulfovibrio aminophilus]|uniref:PD-(D/E)XK nuclease family protein n=1 Tax=Desulfovibrio aminophilus TaxID=81425 RepID=UPI003393463E